MTVSTRAVDSSKNRQERHLEVPGNGKNKEISLETGSHDRAGMRNLKSSLTVGLHQEYR
jgi:hypothetical protein